MFVKTLSVGKVFCRCRVLMGKGVCMERYLCGKLFVVKVPEGRFNGTLKDY